MLAASAAIRNFSPMDIVIPSRCRFRADRYAIEDIAARMSVCRSSRERAGVSRVSFHPGSAVERGHGLRI